MSTKMNPEYDYYLKYDYYLENSIEPFILEMLLAAGKIEEVTSFKWEDTSYRRFKISTHIRDQFDCFKYAYPIWEPSYDQMEPRAKK